MFITFVILIMLGVAIVILVQDWEKRQARIQAERWANWKAWLEDSFARLPRPFAKTPERFKRYDLDDRQVKFIYALAQAGKAGVSLGEFADLWGEPILTPVDELRFFKSFGEILDLVYFQGGFGPLKGYEDKIFELGSDGERYLFERKII